MTRITPILFVFLVFLTASAEAAVTTCFEDAQGRALARLSVEWPVNAWQKMWNATEHRRTDHQGCVTFPNASAGDDVAIHAQSRNLRIVYPDPITGTNRYSWWVNVSAGTTVVDTPIDDSLRLAVRLEAMYVTGLKEFSPWDSWYLGGTALNTNHIIEVMYPGAVVDLEWVQPYGPFGAHQPIIHIPHGAPTDGDRPDWVLPHELGHALHFSRISEASRMFVMAEYANALWDDATDENGKTGHSNDKPSTPFVAFIEAFGEFADVYRNTPRGSGRHGRFWSRARAVDWYDTVSGEDVEGAVFGTLFVEWAATPGIGLDFVVSRYVDCEEFTLRDFASCIESEESGYAYRTLVDAALRFDIELPESDRFSGVLTQQYHGGIGTDEAGDGFGRAMAQGDFNGDGFIDLAVGAPHENGAKGAVRVYSGGPRGFARGVWWTQTEVQGGADAEPGDLFGAALAGGDFNGDGYDDLAVGSPGENADAGHVSMIYGSADGLHASTAWFQGETRYRRAGAVHDMNTEAGDLFGAALAVGDVNGDGFDDLVAGAPGEDGVGWIQVFRGTSYGLHDVGWLYGQSHTTGASDVVARETGDRFGSALAVGDVDGDGRDDVVVGAPGEDRTEPVWMFSPLGFSPIRMTNTLYDAGAVSIFHGSPGAEILEDGETLIGDAAHERFGTAVAVLRRLHGGAVAISAEGSALYTFTESAFFGSSVDALGVTPTPLFGQTLAPCDFDGDGIDELLVGDPGNGGTLHHIDGANQVISLVQEHWGAATHSNDHFGASALAGDLDGDGDQDLMVGVPRGDHHVNDAGKVLYARAAHGGLP